MTPDQHRIMWQVLDEVSRERLSQDAKWGIQDHPDIPKGCKTPHLFFDIPTADAARLFCQDAFRRGTGSYAHIFLEEVSEAIEDADTPEKLRAELIQVAAVCVAWVEKIDRDAVKGAA